MELLPLLTSSIFFVSILRMIFFYKRKTNNKKLPPGKTGWPIIGESFELVSTGQSGHPDIFFKKRMSKYSTEVFKSSIAGEKVAVFCGPSGNKFLFSNENKLVVSWVPPSIQKITGSNTSTMKNGIRKVIPEFVKPEALKRYIPIIDSSTRSQLQREWVSEREVKVFHLSRNLTFSLVCKLFMSIEDNSFVTQFANDFKKVAAGLFSIPVNLPGTTFNRAIKAANLMRERLVPIIKERRRVEKRSSEFHDLLTKFVTWRDEDGKLLNEMETANSILGVLLASHDNTSTLITFVVYYLADHPLVYAKVVKEQVEILKSKQAGELLNWDDIQRMKYSRNVVSEVLRLEPPLSGFFRHAINDLTYANFSIPKGWKTFWSVHTTHKDQKYFKDPYKFDPTRFEGKGPMPYTFVPFGGGPRMCPGSEFARTLVLVFMHNLVTKYKFDKIIPNETIVYAPSPIPVHGLPVTLSPRQT